MKANIGKLCRMVCEYQPFGKPSTSSIGLGTIYSQQRDYHRAIYDKHFHIMWFREELVREIKMETKIWNTNLNYGL